MNAKYEHEGIEKKWLDKWSEMRLFQDVFKDPELTHENKEYLLFAFAYPSGSGLHVGHMEPYVALDILARYKRMKGKKVFYPVGWDAFGLPAENYAVKTKIHPSITTKQAIENFRSQLKRNAISKDWGSEIATYHPEYYKWTQWLFLELYRAGKAYKKMAPANWCPSCQTVLANEQVVDGKCERCGTQVIQKDMDQWFYKITDYAEELISGLDQVDWPEFTKQRQIDWIGKKKGINITYSIDGPGDKVVCFTTRPDTNFGATFIVLAPDSEFVKKNINKFPNKDKVEKYAIATSEKSELDRISDGRKKTGEFTGLYAINNLNGAKMPIYVSDFVLATFGTGAVVGVPGHDKRDFEFAMAMNLPVIRVVVGSDGDSSEITKIEQVQEAEGHMVNSDFLDGMDIHAATEKVMDYLEEKGWGKRVTTYRLRDWLISRQRYWGAPIPIVYDPSGNPHPVKKEHLPWVLPVDVDFLPKGQSPLRLSKEFKERVEKLYGKGWTPEYDTMDTFVDSSWYFLRYVDPRNTKQFASREQLDKLMPVDFYMIGPEHTVLHLLYSRFFTKFLRDQSYFDFDEPFLKMRHQGMILGPDNRKMSKSKGNVINPDDIYKDYGSDTLRVYEMFMGPIDTDKPWDTNGVVGIRKFLSKVWDLSMDNAKSNASESLEKLERLLHKTIKKVSEDIEGLKYNTSIAKFMEFVNFWEKSESVLSREDTIMFIKILAPFAPFISEEIYQHLIASSSKVSDGFRSVHVESWPEYDEQKTIDDTVTIAVQINGKLRATLKNISLNEPEESVKAKAREAAAKYLEGLNVVKDIYILGKVVNLVAK